MESADSQISMLTALLRCKAADDEGNVVVQRDHFVDALERIRTDHRQELQALPTIAERLIACFGITA